MTKEENELLVEQELKDEANSKDDAGSDKPQANIAQGEGLISSIYEDLINNLREQIDSVQDKLLRSMAETENIRVRSNKMAEEAREYSITAFARDLVPVIDNLSRALEHAPAGLPQEVQIIVDGVDMTKRELENVFKKHGLEPIEPIPGEKFDYNKHNAISKVVTDEFEEGSIVSTMQVGYKIKDRLLRPASVTVAKK